MSAARVFTLPLLAVSFPELALKSVEVWPADEPETVPESGGVGFDVPSSCLQKERIEGIRQCSSNVGVGVGVGVVWFEIISY